MPQPPRRVSPGSLLQLLLVTCAFLAAARHAAAPPTAALAGEASPRALEHAAPEDGLTSRFVNEPSGRFVHAASITTLAKGGLYAAWYAGSGEGAGDVRIFGARFDPVGEQWSPEQVLATAEGTQAALGMRVRSLGNPVVAEAPDGRLWLFYVSVSFGGWATSSLNLATSTDEGRTWGAPVRLVTSPFFNLSTLTRGRPVFYQDGSAGLPVYHEALGKFPEYARVAHDGRVLDKARLDAGRRTLQPYIVALGASDLLALLRDASEAHRVFACRSRDAGRSWSAPQATAIPNPDAAIAAVRYDRDTLLVALNDVERGRGQMSLYLADVDLRQWQRLAVMEESEAESPVAFEAFTRALAARFVASASPSQRPWLPTYLASWSERDPRGCGPNGCEFSYDYPDLRQSADDRFELTYSWNKSLIKHVSVSRSWVERRRGGQP